MPSSRKGYDRSRQGELQRMLGDLGRVLPRVMHGSPSRPAQGWYAELAPAAPCKDAGRTVFLGDYSMLAGLTISRLLKEAGGRDA